MITIALDAMGGDHAPRAEVEGAVLAARELGVRVILTGNEAAIRQELGRTAFVAWWILRWNGDQTLGEVEQSVVVDGRLRLTDRTFKRQGQSSPVQKGMWSGVA